MEVLKAEKYRLEHLREFFADWERRSSRKRGFRPVMTFCGVMLKDMDKDLLMDVCLFLAE